MVLKAPTNYPPCLSLFHLLLQPNSCNLTSTKRSRVFFHVSLAWFPMVSFGWTQSTASRLGIPRLIFYGMNNYATTISTVIGRDRPHAKVDSYDELFTVPCFPSIQLTKNDLEYPFNDPYATGPQAEFILDLIETNMQSKGILVNSFYELEAKFINYWNNEIGIGVKAWSVGPLCLAEPPKAQATEKPSWAQWLDECLTRGRSVMYVAFGSQAEITLEQLQEIANGLERSNVSFLWVVRSMGFEVLDRFEERVKDRGLIVRDWVDQVEILRHECVNGFMSHCGWNSVIESICESVPILAWPMMAEQHLNAKMVVEELGVGLRVLAINGSVRGFVSSECIESMVKELMEGEKGKEVRKKVKELGELARKAVVEGGSSWRTLDELLEEVYTML
ncbi:hypothetical protein IFM89_036839 [Coptis chinensis]|uniref:Glycosyltransferase n=1 Tax=Coptis chinensis TaxID=261450 RepID=A0A835H1Y6_9MAGN|nr:hypothetical protein IFM89_036839 [Coptis chinensis]